MKLVALHGSNSAAGLAVEAEETRPTHVLTSEDSTFGLTPSTMARWLMARWAGSSCLERPSIWKQMGKSHVRSAAGKTSFQSKAESHSGKMVMKGSSPTIRTVL